MFKVALNYALPNNTRNLFVTILLLPHLNLTIWQTNWNKPKVHHSCQNCQTSRIHPSTSVNLKNTKMYLSKNSTNTSVWFIIIYNVCLGIANTIILTQKIAKKNFITYNRYYLLKYCLNL